MVTSAAHGSPVMAVSGPLNDAIDDVSSGSIRHATAAASAGSVPGTYRSTGSPAKVLPNGFTVMYASRGSRPYDTVLVSETGPACPIGSGRTQHPGSQSYRR